MRSGCNHFTVPGLARLAQIALSITAAILAGQLIQNSIDYKEKPPKMFIGSIIVSAYVMLHIVIVEPVCRRRIPRFFIIAGLDFIPVIALIILIYVSGKPLWSLECSKLPGSITGVKTDYVGFVKAASKLCEHTKILLGVNVALCIFFVISIVAYFICGVLLKKSLINV